MTLFADLAIKGDIWTHQARPREQSVPKSIFAIWLPPSSLMRPGARAGGYCFSEYTQGTRQLRVSNSL